MFLDEKSPEPLDNSWMGQFPPEPGRNNPTTLPGLKTPLPRCSQTPLQRGCPQATKALHVAADKGARFAHVLNLDFRNFPKYSNGSV